MCHIKFMNHNEINVTIAKNGRMVIPAKFRKALGLEEGGNVTVSLKGDTIAIQSKMARLKAAQEYVAKHFGHKKDSIVDDFLADKRAEAKREWK